MEFKVGDRVLTKDGAGTIRQIDEFDPEPLWVDLDDAAVYWPVYHPDTVRLEARMQAQGDGEVPIGTGSGKVYVEGVYVGKADSASFTNDVEKFRLYIAGPMTGKQDFNRPLFFAVERKLNEGRILLTEDLLPKKWLNVGPMFELEVVNPAGLDANDTNVDQGDLGATPWEYYLQRDLQYALTVDGIILIDDWWNSRGAVLEAFVGYTLNKPIFQLNVDGTVSRAEDKLPVTFEAHAIVLGARRYTYGHPLENFERIALRWNATLADKLNEPLDITDVAFLMIDVKMAREQNTPKKDNLTDIVGYATALHEAIRQQEWIEEVRIFAARQEYEMDQAHFVGATT